MMTRLQNIAKKTPIALSGLLLAFTAMGNLLTELRPVLLIGMAIILIALINKLVFDFQGVVRDSNNLALIGIVNTFPMASSVFSSYIRPYNEGIAYGLWMASVIMSGVLVLVHMNLLRKNFKLESIFPSTLIVYGGTVVHAFFASAYGNVLLGKGVFWFGLITVGILLPIVLKRMRSLANPLIPTLAILTAPVSVLLNASMSLYGSSLMTLTWILFGFSLGLWFLVLVQVPRILRVPFNPSYTALTFPFVITALSSKTLNGLVMKLETPSVILNVLAQIQLVIAVLALGFVTSLFIYNYIIKPLRICVREGLCSI